MFAEGERKCRITEKKKRKKQSLTKEERASVDMKTVSYSCTYAFSQQLANIAKSPNEDVTDIQLYTQLR